MPDDLPISREAIEAHIREKGVTKVPMGKSGIFDEHGNYIENPLKRGGAIAGRNMRFRAADRKRERADPAAVPARRANAEKFAAALEDTRKAPEKPPAPRPAPKARSRQKHDAEIREMVGNDWSVPMIAEALGMARSGVRSACARLGLEPRKERAKDTDRKRQVGEMIEAGKTAVEIAEEVGITASRVYQIATALGVKVRSRRAPKLGAAPAASLPSVPEPAPAPAGGVPPETVAEALRALERAAAILRQALTEAQP